MNLSDEPVFDSSLSTPLKESEIQEKILSLLSNENFCVLSTMGNENPYSSLIGFNFSSDMKQIYFCTQIATKKYNLLKNCSSVSLLADSRSRYKNHIGQLDAVTIIGKAEELNDKPCEYAIQELQNKLPYLKPFLQSPSTAVFAVDIEKYIYVSRFQEVYIWTP